MATKITLSTGNVGYVWSTYTVSNTNETTAKITVTAHAYLTNGWVQSTGIAAFITINGTQSSALTILGNGTRYDASDGTKTVSFSVNVSRGTANKTINWSVGFWQYTDKVQQTRKHLGEGTATVSKKPSYTITYKPNGGTGGPSSQTKWYGDTLKLSTSKPTRTGYSFSKWNTNSGGTGTIYASGANYTANAAATLYAQWTANTYTVTFNANGGTGGPTTQTKTYGKDLTLSTSKPTKTNYTFLGWATSKTATTAKYSAGDTYSANEAVTLYAVWQLSYVAPTITNFSVDRCDDKKNEVDEGTYAFVSFDWATEKTASKVVVEWRDTSTSTWSSQEFTISGTSGTFSQACCKGGLNVDKSYIIKATVYDAGGSNYVQKTLTNVLYALDILNGGTGAAFGKAATRAGALDMAWHIIVGNALNIQGVWDGTAYNQFQPINANGNCVLGYGMYDAGIGATNIYGNQLSFTSKNTIKANKPIELHAMTCTCSADLQLTTASQKVTMGSVAHTSGNLLTAYDGGIKCTVDGYVLVAATVYGQDITAGQTLACTMYKNTTALSLSVAATSNYKYAAANWQTSIMQVKAGDVLYLRAHNVNAATGYIYTNVRSKLTVMYVG